ncbi:MAG: hypothetical protein J6R45_00335 [Clostridia bacterium]|nr:hypothetical protein [Clostridia bacterium]
MEFIEVLNQYQHMQGFSNGNGYMYWSFTDTVVKTTMNGIVKCQVQIHGGHLGDIDYHDGKIYASYLKNSLPGHAWEDWTGFKIYVFNADDLHVEKIMNLDICDYYKSITCTPEDTRGFQGIDGVTIAPDPKTGEDRLFVACALYTGEKYSNQIILQFTLDGVYETEYHIPTGNTVFGIQNLDYDAENKEFWFTTYGPSQPYMPREMLFCISGDLSTILRKYNYSTPYGLDCLGKAGFYGSVHTRKAKKCGGIAYRCDESFFATPKSPQELVAMKLEAEALLED